MGAIRPPYTRGLSQLKLRRDRVEKLHRLIETMIELADTIDGDFDLEDDDPARCDCHEDLGTGYQCSWLEPERNPRAGDENEDSEEDDQNVLLNAPLGQSEDDEPDRGPVAHPRQEAGYAWLKHQDPEAFKLVFGYDLRKPRRTQ